MFVLLVIELARSSCLIARQDDASMTRAPRICIAADLSFFAGNDWQVIFLPLPTPETVSTAKWHSDVKDLATKMTKVPSSEAILEQKEAFRGQKGSRFALRGGVRYRARSGRGGSRPPSEDMPRLVEQAREATKADQRGEHEVTIFIA